MDISIVIPTYNRIDYLKRTLKSIDKQKLHSKEISFEVVVIDDGSNDGTAELIRNYDYIKYIWQEDKGFRASKARNIGAVYSSGELIIYIDCGLILHENFIENYYRTYKTNSECEAFVGQSYAFNNEDLVNRLLTKYNDRFDDEVDKELIKYGVIDIRQPRYDLLGTDLSKWFAPYDIFWSLNVAVKRESLYKVGLFDESYTKWGGEDIDLAIRLQLYGCKFFLNQSSKTIHIPHLSEYSEEKVALGENILHQKHNHRITSFLSVARENNTDINTYCSTQKIV